MEFLFDNLHIPLAFLLVLTIVVFVHEFGHFIVARACGVRVDVFSIGFGRELLGFTDRWGTRWKFSLIPLGGYVKMFGDADAASARTADLPYTDEEKRQAFPFKSLPQRAAVVVAGPLFNFIFAILVFAILFMVVGRPEMSPAAGQVEEGMPAAEAGIEPGDVFLTVDGTPVDRFEDLRRIVGLTVEGQTLEVVVRRGEGEAAERVTVYITPQWVDDVDFLGNVTRVPRIGVRSFPHFEDTEALGPGSALIAGVDETIRLTGVILTVIQQIVVGERDTSQLGGPIQIAEVSGHAASVSALALITFIAVLSINLGLINLFPVPMLDGGHLLYYGIEAVRGRPLSERAQEIGLRFGLAMVMVLMVFVTYNDIHRIIQRLEF